MVKKAAAAGGAAEAADREGEERRRLRSRAFSKGLLRRGEAASAAAAALAPAKAVVRLQGRDVVRRGGQRRSRFLFSFPGLLAPAAAAGGGGRVGELADLGSRNPVLFLEFPQGRMKLFGTHVYPKNKYLTLQMTKSAKGVVCEDVFESLIVFSEAWWVGTKDENPEELKLEFPKIFENGEPAADCDFKGGAGATTEDAANGNKPGKDTTEALSPKFESEDDSPEDSGIKVEKSARTASESTPVRQSARTTQKALNYAESSSGGDSANSDGEVAEDMDNKLTSKQMESPAVKTESHSTDNVTIEESSFPSAIREGNLSVKKQPLVQTTLSTMFKKTDNTKRSTSSPKGSPAAKGPSGKKQRTCSKGKSNQSQMVKVSSKEESQPSGKKSGIGTRAKQKSKIVDDDIEEISSSPQDDNGDDDDSDEDWAG